MAASSNHRGKQNPPEKQWNHGERRQVVAEMLMTEILQGTLRAGTRLVIKDLAERYEVSPTPVREALVSLEGIGIVNVSPNRGAVVRELSADDAVEICQVRTVLECEATRLACGRIPGGELDELAGQFDQLGQRTDLNKRFMQKSRWLDSRLHDLIAEHCGNRFLRQELGRMKLLFRGVRDVSWEHLLHETDSMRYREEVEEHALIVDCLKREDAEAASRAMAIHIGAGMTYWMRALTSD